MSMQIVLQTELFPRESVHHSDYALNKKREETAEENLVRRKHKGPPRKDRTGQRYGMLLIEGMIDERNHGSTVFVCKCDCGCSIKVTGSHLTPKNGIGGLTHCGCMGVGKSKKSAPGTLGLTGKKRVTTPNETVAFNGLYAGYRQAATSRGLVWELSRLDFHHLITGNCHYCGVEPKQERTSRKLHSITYNGVDRVDSSQGYSPANCVSCCGLCNIAKMDHGVSEFLDWVERVHNHQEKIRSCR